MPFGVRSIVNEYEICMNWSELFKPQPFWMRDPFRNHIIIHVCIYVYRSLEKDSLFNVAQYYLLPTNRRISHIILTALASCPHNRNKTKRIHWNLNWFANHRRFIWFLVHKLNVDSIERWKILLRKLIQFWLKTIQ